ncbi:MAG TPA: hypothetical protein PKE45_04395 [Caldilineaceae bacterium]|nr:hypothetical protein [Caldilineaceae bacterium]
MTLVNRPNPYSLVRLPPEQARGERPVLRRFRWMVAGGVLVLAALLAPALAATPPTGELQPVISTPGAGLAVTTPGPREATLGSSQPQPIPDKRAVRHSTALTTPPPIPTSAAITDGATLPIITGAMEAVAHRIFLAVVLRTESVGNASLLQGALATAPSAAADDSSGLRTPINAVLFLPLVASTTAQDHLLAQRQPADSDQLRPAVIVTPTDLSMASVRAAVNAPALAPGQNRPARQQVQVLIDQVQQLIASGALSAVQGQPLLDPLTALLQFPIVTQGQASPNLAPGQSRPWQRKLQSFDDRVNELIASGVLSAAQAQPLLDQAQVIHQTLAEL